MTLKNFIVFEGIDGSGTSTQIKKLVERDLNKFVATAEPTKKETGLFLRKMLGGDFSVDSKTAAYLFAADRCEHIYGKDGVIDLLNQGKIVVSDRYFFSSLAYQSVSCGNELPRLLNSQFPLPEILFYFYIDPEISLKRVEKIDYQKKTAALYEEVINEYSKPELKDEMKIIKIDASKSIEEISQIIWQNVQGMY